MSKKYFALFFVGFLAFAFCPNVFAKYPPVQNERFVINALRQIYNAQVQYQASVGAGDFGHLAQLRQVNLIDGVLASGQKYGYFFTVTATSATPANPPQFVLTAVPRLYRKTGVRSFYIDHRCTLRGADKKGGQATINDPAIEPCVPAIINQNEALVILAFRTLHSAQATYQSTTGNGNFGTFFALLSAGLIGEDLAFGRYRQYIFTCFTQAATSTTPASYKIWAIPLGYGETGIRSFYIDTSGILRGADIHGQVPTGNEPPIENLTAE
ncbi:MAG TPA: hypothetical protein VF721_00280 [Pyrinomonadaceae bacterium]|jgi:hypothetical protein